MLRVGQTSLRSRIAVEFRSLHSIVKGCLQFTYYAPVCIARRSVSEEERRLDATQVRNPLGKIVWAGKKERKREDVRGKRRERGREIAKIGKAENKESRPLTSLLREPLLNL